MRGSEAGGGLVGLRLRATARQRAGAYLTVVVVVGLLGGVAMAAVAGARRTQSSYPQYLASTDPTELTVSIYNPNGGGAAPGLSSGLAAIPGVRRVTQIVALSLFALNRSGVVRQQASSQALALGSTDGEFTSVDRLAAAAGREADPSRVDEITMTASAARILGYHVGDVVNLGYFTPAQERLPGIGSRPIAPAMGVRARLVGLVDISSQVIQDDVDRQYGFIFATPALVRRLEARWPSVADPTAYGLQLAPGTSVVGVERRVEALVPGGYTYQFHVVARVVAAVELSMRPMSIALGAFGAIAGLVALALSAQAIGRLVRGLDDERRVLWALGATPRESVADALAGAGLAGAAGVILAELVATALSPLAPIGPVRAVYPTRGVSVDPLVQGLGALVLLIALAGAAGLAARLGSPARVRAVRGPRRASVVSRLAGVPGVPVAASVGVAMATGSGDRRASAPARSVLVGTVVAVALVSTTLTFSSGLSTLVGRPALYGWDWSYALNPSNDVPPGALAMLSHDPDVTAWSGYGYTNAVIDGATVPVLIGRAGARVQPPVTSGHGLESNGQIVLGAATMAELGAKVGGTVVVTYGSPKTAPIYVPPTRLRVVGTATFPAVGYSSIVADHTSMGTGALFPEGILPPAFQRAMTFRDPVLNGPELVFVRLRPGAGAAGRRGLERIAAAATRTFARDPNPNARGNAVSLIGVQRPAQIVNYRTIGSTPLVLAVALAGGALVALAATLGSSVRRRRRDLALLKCLGFTPRMLRAAVGVQATVVALVGAVVGVPVGVLAGRWLWDAFAAGIDAVPDATVPVVALVAVAAGALVFANMVAAAPGRRAARVAASLVLHSE